MEDDCGPKDTALAQKAKRVLLPAAKAIGPPGSAGQCAATGIRRAVSRAVRNVEMSPFRQRRTEWGRYRADEAGRGPPRVEMNFARSGSQIQSA